MITPTNGLTFMRGPIALLFFVENLYVRLGVIAAAMITDGIDGYLARKYRCTSRFGAILDPLMDKFFVFIVLAVFYSEGKIAPWQICAMVTRDFSLLLFGTYLFANGLWKAYRFKSVLWGKVSTALQFVTLVMLTFGVTLPNSFYSLFILCGSLAFIELLHRSRSQV